MMNSRESLTGPINIGNPGEFTILELAQKVIELTDSNSKLVYKLLPEDDPVKRKPNIYLAIKELNWKQNVKLVNGLKSKIKYFEPLLVKEKYVRISSVKKEILEKPILAKLQ